MECQLSLPSPSLQFLPERRQTPTDLLKPSSGTTGNLGVENPQTSEDIGSLDKFEDKCSLHDYAGQTIAGGNRKFRVNRKFFEGCPSYMQYRMSRANTAREFVRNYVYGSSTDAGDLDEKVCIWPSNSFTLKEPSSGITWVAVHGVDSICVVTSVDSLDMQRLGGFLKNMTGIEILCHFLVTVVSGIEDLAFLSSPFGRLSYLNSEKPFSVVSLIPYTDESDEKSGQEDPIFSNYDDKMPVKFLEEKMKIRDSTSTADKTIQTAISALQHMFVWTLKAHEIQGCVLQGKREKVEFLEICDVEKHLAVIKEHGA